ncbi:MAG: class B sortase [Lachnospiraceae bacterium]|nr:class B sortase [Lachnospiraceae bacterium]
MNEQNRTEAFPMRKARRAAAVAAVLGPLLMAAGAALLANEWAAYLDGQGQEEESRKTKETQAPQVVYEEDGHRDERTLQDLSGIRRPDEEKTEAEDRSGDSRIAAVDFEILWEMNSDVAAWIEIPGTAVSYPVLFRAGDSGYYLTHRADGTKGRQGAIHIDGLAEKGIESRNILIYGHSQLDGSMFASLHSYKNEDFYRRYPYVYLHMPDGSVRQYRIAACILTDGVEEEWYQYGFSCRERAQAYYDRFMEQSLYDTGVGIAAGEERQTLVLSTCYQKRYRRLILAVREPD